MVWQRLTGVRRMTAWPHHTHRQETVRTSEYSAMYTHRALLF